MLAVNLHVISMYGNSFDKIAPSMIFCARLCGKTGPPDTYGNKAWDLPLFCATFFLAEEASGYVSPSYAHGIEIASEFTARFLLHPIFVARKHMGHILCPTMYIGLYRHMMYTVPAWADVMCRVKTKKNQQNKRYASLIKISCTKHTILNLVSLLSFSNYVYSM